MTLTDNKRKMFKGRMRRDGSLPRLSVDDIAPERFFKKPPNPEIGV